jgi:hypothetical protein
VTVVPQRAARRHHYVPQFYQKGFADTDQRLWLYDRGTQRYFKAHPVNICCENDLYTVNPGGTRNSYLETKWLSKVDGDGAAAIRQFEAGIALDLEWEESFSLFMAQQITRTPAFRDSTTRNYRLLREEYLRIGFTDVDRAGQLLARYREETSDPVARCVTAESLVRAVVGGRIKVSVDEGPFLSNMVRQIEFLAKWIISFEWQVLKAPEEETGFILCDYPFVIVPPREHPEDFGLAFPGTIKYFPLTRTLCLRMGDLGYGRSYRNVGKEDVRRINQNIAVNSERYIMGPNRTQMEYVVSRSGTIAADSEPRTIAEVVRSDRDGGTIGFTFWPRRRYFYPKI